MSDDPPQLIRPDPPRTWRERLWDWAEALDLTPTRLVAGTVVLVIAAVTGWRLLAPPPTPPEMRLPFASSTTSSAPPSSSPGSGSATAGASEEVVVHVAGAVHAPGIQRLSDGARVVDAVDAAGGARPDADVARINLAALIEDGQQVYIPVVGEEVPRPVGSSAGAAASDGSPPSAPLDLNSATADDLDELPGIGPAIAAAIVSHRDSNGPFGSVEELLDVRGIGDAKLDQLRPLVRV